MCLSSVGSRVSNTIPSGALRSANATSDVRSFANPNFIPTMKYGLNQIKYATGALKYLIPGCKVGVCNGVGVNILVSPTMGWRYQNVLPRRSLSSIDPCDNGLGFTLDSTDDDDDDDDDEAIEQFYRYMISMNEKSTQQRHQTRNI
jgi:hypothetical protein